MNRSTANLIKIVAMVTMLIDHIGAILYPEIFFLRIIGRIAFPLFAYLLVMGFRHTGNINRYLLRLFLFGLISQIPYHYVLPGHINVILYFAVALVSLKLYAPRKQHLYIPILAALLTEILNMSYGAYGIMTIYLFHFFFEDRPKLAAGFILLNLPFIGIFGHYVQSLSIMALPFLFLRIEHLDIRLNKYFAYLFYPVHLSILLLIKYYGLL